MIRLLIVGTGGFLGSVSRYILSGLVHRLITQAVFPYGTLTVNVLGCLAIGFLSGLAESRQLFSPEMRLLMFIGFLGGFTTFSTFGYEIVSFARDGQLMASLANLMLHLVLGLGAVWTGLALSRAI
ncbi:MAG: fluoride efflux transporter CrcB [Candidatus Marinimicrobia bacterium]|nr:fluoride efflux transporter CrcB [Candidatus Neomarinimicrobiota bacterium]